MKTWQGESKSDAMELVHLLGKFLLLSVPESPHAYQGRYYGCLSGPVDMQNGKEKGQLGELLGFILEESMNDSFPSKGTRQARVSEGKRVSKFRVPEIGLKKGIHEEKGQWKAKIDSEVNRAGTGL